MPPQNPFAIPSPVDMLYGTADRPQQQYAPIQPLSPDEQQSMLDRIGSASLHGLGYLGGSLSKAFGGRAIRGLLGGRPEELASIIPFSDAMGITNPENEVRGSDLLGGNKDTSLLSLEGLGGLGIDIATDPLTYLTGGAGALTNLGKTAAKAGIKMPGYFQGAARAAGFAAGTPEANALARAASLGGASGPLSASQLADVAGKSLGGHVGLHVPFTDMRTAFDLSPGLDALSSLYGKLPGSQYATQAGKAVGSLYNQTVPPLFENAVRGISEPRLQPIARDVTTEIAAAENAARESMQPLRDKALEMIGYKGGPLTDQVRNAQMGLGREFKMFREGNLIGPARPGMEELNNMYSALAGENLQKNVGKGLLLNTTKKPGEFEYLARQATPLAVEPYRPDIGGGKLGPTAQKARKDLFMGPVQIPVEGPNSLNELSIRTDLPQMQPMQSARVIAEDYLKITAQDRNAAQATRQALTSGNLQNITTQQLDQLKHVEDALKQADSLASWQKGLDHATLATTGGFFPNHPLADLELKLMKDAGKFVKANGLHRSVAEMAEPAAALGRDGVPLLQVLTDAGLNLAGVQNPQAMSETIMELQKLGKMPPGTLPASSVQGLAVHKDMVPFITKFLNTGSSPDGMKPFLGIIDSITNWTKGFQTAFWPSSKARNQNTAMFQNWVHDAFDPAFSGPKSYVMPWLDAKKWYSGQTMESATRIPGYGGLSAEEATRKFASEVYNYNVPRSAGSQAQEVLGQIPKDSVKELAVPGVPQKPFTQILKEGIPDTTAPWKVKGAFGNTEDLFKPVKAGRELDTSLDATNKVSAYLAKRLQGFTPEAALKETMAAHYDFSSLTDFEKNVMRRVIPFYSWARQNVPAVVQELAERPGGKMGMAVKAAFEAQGRQPGFTPEMLGQGLAAKVGGTDEQGKQTYLSSTGLPFEDVTNLSQPGGILGMMNPILKAPLELMTNRQFFTGRDLSGVAPHTGSTYGDQLVGASPLGRFATTGRMLADPRTSVAEAAFNLLSGGRLTDVDQASAQRQAVLARTEEMLKENPLIRQFSNIYIPREQRASLTPAELALLRLHETTRQNR